MANISMSAFIGKHNPEDINKLPKILKEHKKWLENHEEGQCACLVDMDLTEVDLSNADLSYANLAGANLLKANLSGANFTGTNLKGCCFTNGNLTNAKFDNAMLSSSNICHANCEGASFKGADIRDATMWDTNFKMTDFHFAILCCSKLCDSDFTGANLKCADLYCTDMDNTIFVDANLNSARLIYAQRAYWADFTNADLSGVDTCDCSLNEEKMNGAKNFHPILLCPDEGSFIAWKKCSSDCIVKLLIPESAKRVGTCRYTLRASEAKVLEITDKEGNILNEANSHNEPSFTYKAGEIVRPKEDFDDHMFLDGSGIHFFLTRAEAQSYKLPKKDSDDEE